MIRYYFDLRDGDDLAPDEEGVELPDIEHVQEEAALALAQMARDVLPRTVTDDGGHRIAIEVRDEAGPVLKVFFTFEADRQRRH
jgi:hypothetical protein